ncbi:MAG: hypothetical protein JWQ04_2455 [Pedosphaera sp.]|nr:hypothetical protein [Pedosphaera sp.]
MDIAPLQPQVKASTLPFEQMAKNPNVPQAEKVQEACRQFEAVLVRQILTEARKTVISSSVQSDSNASGIYNDMINNQMADRLTHTGGFGLAKSLESQLVRQVLPKAKSAASLTTPAPTSANVTPARGGGISPSAHKASKYPVTPSTQSTIH